MSVENLNIKQLSDDLELAKGRLEAYFDLVCQLQSHGHENVLVVKEIALLRARNDLLLEQRTVQFETNLKLQEQLDRLELELRIYRAKPEL